MTTTRLYLTQPLIQATKRKKGKTMQLPMNNATRKKLRYQLRTAILQSARTLLLGDDATWMDGGPTWFGTEASEDAKAAFEFLRMALRDSDAWGAFWKGYDEA